MREDASRECCKDTLTLRVPHSQRAPQRADWTAWQGFPFGKTDSTTVMGQATALEAF